MNPQHSYIKKKKAKKTKQKARCEQVVVAYTFDPSTQEAEAGESLSSRPDWSTSSKTARATQGNPVLEKKIKKTCTIVQVYDSIMAVGGVSEAGRF